MLSHAFNPWNLAPRLPAPPRCARAQTLHVGDRFTLSGNDTATRDVCRCGGAAAAAMLRGRCCGGAAAGALLRGRCCARAAGAACEGPALLHTPSHAPPPLMPALLLPTPARSVLWVANPEETGFFIKMLLKDIRKSRWQPYIE
jgi:hypothetical protein